jgi:hypothetical protein
MDLTTKDKLEITIKNEEEKNDIEISLRDIMEVLLKGKRIIVSTALIFLIGAFIYFKFFTPSTIQTLISLNFKGIEKGLDPNGKNFDISVIESPSNIDKVIEKLGLSKKGITTDYIRGSVSITPIIPAGITEKIKKQNETKSGSIKDQQEYAYYPNIYTISMSIGHNSKIDSNTAKKILDDIVKQYQEYFFETYTDKNALTNAIGVLDYDGYDYPEISIVMHDQILIIQNHITAKLKDKNTTESKNTTEFRSTKTGVSFSEITSYIDVISKVDIGRLDSIIEAYNISKDKDKLIKLYEYRIRDLELKMSKKSDEAKIVSDTLSKYQKDKKLILLPGQSTTGSDVSGVLDLDKTSDYYNELTQRFMDLGVESKNGLHDIEYYKKMIVKFKNDTVTVDEKKNAEKLALELIPDIKGKIEKWVGITNDSVGEYSDRYFNQDAMKVLSVAQETGKSINLVLVISVLIGCGLGIFGVLFKEYWRKSQVINK